MVATTRPRAGITHRLHGITSQRRVITPSREFINRHRAITTTGAIRIVDGTVMTAAGGTVVNEAVEAMTIEATIDRIIVEVGAITMMAIAMAEAAAGKPLNKKAALEAPLFCA
jgi:hypothetical protein